MVSAIGEDKKGVTTKRIIIFNGSGDQWEPFREQWLAMNSHRGWTGILDGTDVVPTKDEVDAVLAKSKSTRTPEDKDILRRHEKNVECFNILVISMDASTRQGKLAFHLVITCKKPEYPQGNSKSAFDKLVSKYAPKNTQTELSLRKQLANTRLNLGEDPDEFMMKIEVLAMDINAMSKSTSDITDHDLMAHVLNNLPSNYDPITDGLERQFNEKKLTLDILREKLQSRHKRLDQIEEEDVDSPETALAAITSFKKRFKGVCWVCGKRGHRSSECKDRKTEEKTEEKANIANDDDDDFTFSL